MVATRPSVCNQRAVLMELLCLIGLNDGIRWTSGELDPSRYYSLHEDNWVLTQPEAATVMQGAVHFVPLPEEVNPYCALLNLPNNLTQDWAIAIKDFCSYYLMNEDKYVLLAVATIIENAPGQYTTGILRDCRISAERARRAWKDKLSAAKLAVSNFI